MRILVPLPLHDFDPSETAVPWRALVDAGHEVVFATPDGSLAEADARILSGRGFGPWRPFLRAVAASRERYAQMVESASFRAPLAYADIDPDAHDGMILTGGHAPRMKEYLESELVQRCVVAHMRADKPVGAICHGVLVPARSIDPETGRSVLHGRRTTCLTRAQEMMAWAMTGLWLGSYYRTYQTTVEEEVVAALASPDDFESGPFTVRREGPESDVGFTVRDGNYISGRYYVDAYAFASGYVELLAEHEES